VRPAPPPHQHCWVYSKWGRKKAKVIMEYLQIGGEDHGKTLLLVKVMDNKLLGEMKYLTIEKRFIEYIKN